MINLEKVKSGERIAKNFVWVVKKKFKQSFEKVKFNAYGELARNITQHRAHSPTASQRRAVFKGFL